jgi:hypothetical protein
MVTTGVTLGLVPPVREDAAVMAGSDVLQHLPPQYAVVQEARIGLVGIEGNIALAFAVGVAVVAVFGCPV